MDVSHALRPEFTQYITQKLLEGSAVNVIGTEEQGSVRLVEDIAVLDIADTDLIVVNMRSCRNSFDSFLRTISWQVGLQRTPNTIPVLFNMLKNSGKKIILLLKHLDAILDNPNIDPRFNVEFFDYLNSFKNTSQFALLVLTALPHDNSLVYIQGKVHSNSWLELQPEAISELTVQHIESELERQLENDPLWQQHRKVFISTVYAHPAPYLFLQHVVSECRQMDQSNENIEQLFEKWQKNYKRIYRNKNTGRSIQNFFLALDKFLILTRLKRPQKDIEP